MKENLLKKEFRHKDVERARNLIRKDFHARTLSGVGYAKAQVDYQEGDIWEEDGKQWTIKNGIKQTMSKLDSIRKQITKPLSCPVCKGTMNHRLHDKMWKIHGMCFDCVVEMEGQLRVMGKYEAYERAMLTGNLEKWAADMQQYAKQALSELNETYVTEQGDVEDWKNNDKAIEQRILTNMQDYVSQVQEAISKLQQ